MPLLFKLHYFNVIPLNILTHIIVSSRMSQFTNQHILTWTFNSLTLAQMHPLIQFMTLTMLNVFYFTHLHAKMIPFLHKNSPQCHYFYRWLQPIYSVIIKHGLFLRDGKLEHSLAINSFLCHTPLETIKKKNNNQRSASRRVVELCSMGARGIKI